MCGPKGQLYKCASSASVPNFIPKLSKNPNTIALTPKSINTPITENFFPLIYSLILLSFKTVRFITVKIAPISNKK